MLERLAFGLATDYAVFLLSRIKEARDSGRASNDAVAIGLERTGRIVTAAALLFAVAVAAFATSKLVFIKELGLGTALVVLIDATVVRALLVSSLMVLLGNTTETRTGTCAQHGRVKAEREPPKLAFPILVSGPKRYFAKRKPFAARSAARP
jgi:hypothetical protein